MIPDIHEIEALLEHVLAGTDDNPQYYLGAAVGRTQKLLEDLERASRLKDLIDENSNDPQ